MTYSTHVYIVYCIFLTIIIIGLNYLFIYNQQLFTEYNFLEELTVQFFVISFKPINIKENKYTIGSTIFESNGKPGTEIRCCINYLCFFPLLLENNFFLIKCTLITVSSPLILPSSFPPHFLHPISFCLSLEHNQDCI